MPTIEAPKTRRESLWNPRLRRMEMYEFDERGIAIALICKDGTRRPVQKTGLEGAYHQSHRDAKVPLVPVTVPKANGGRGRRQVEAILGGMDADLKEFIGFDVAARQYGRQTTDECQKTFAGQLAAAGEQ